jgi:hypothetical protein
VMGNGNGTSSVDGMQELDVAGALAHFAPSPARALRHYQPAAGRLVAVTPTGVVANWVLPCNGIAT